MHHCKSHLHSALGINHARNSPVARSRARRETAMDRDNNTSETNIIFLGGMFPPDSDDWIRQNSIGNIHNAANGMQWNFIQDRKSTRLNSSHVASSYAVFCSKNKIST